MAALMANSANGLRNLHFILFAHEGPMASSFFYCTCAYILSHGSFVNETHKQGIFLHLLMADFDLPQYGVSMS